MAISTINDTGVLSAADREHTLSLLSKAAEGIQARRVPWGLTPAATPVQTELARRVLAQVDAPPASDRAREQQLFVALQEVSAMLPTEDPLTIALTHALSVLPNRPPSDERTRHLAYLEAVYSTARDELDRRANPK